MATNNVPPMSTASTTSVTDKSILPAQGNKTEEKKKEEKVTGAVAENNTNTKVFGGRACNVFSRTITFLTSVYIAVLCLACIPAVITTVDRIKLDRVEAHVEEMNAYELKSDSLLLSINWTSASAQKLCEEEVRLLLSTTHRPSPWFLSWIYPENGGPMSDEWPPIGRNSTEMEQMCREEHERRRDEDYQAVVQRRDEQRRSFDASYCIAPDTPEEQFYAVQSAVARTFNDTWVLPGRTYLVSIFAQEIYSAECSQLKFSRAKHIAVVYLAGLGFFFLYGAYRTLVDW